MTPEEAQALLEQMETLPLDERVEQLGSLEGRLRAALDDAAES